jgi:pyridinium-3,5-biscarboxylic acid mononucleotide sulfurtransferase
MPFATPPEIRDGSMAPMDRARRLLGTLRSRSSLAVAVSGGVDSMTLAAFAHRHSGCAVSMFHAVSPAVPAASTELVRTYARREGWRLTVLDAGEFDDPDYRANPVNRCYFCKTNLYARIREATADTIASGTNRDDLSDFRPGLKAADRHGVVHPFVEADFDKEAVRVLARAEGLTDVAELPAQPCLSSRIETGIAIDAADLAFVDETERALRNLLTYPATIRCRVRRSGVVIELDGVWSTDWKALENDARARCAGTGRIFVGVSPYRRASAFLGAPGVRS